MPPPANTPNQASPEHATSPTSASRPDTPPALSYLSSPVLDLAATLYTQAADEADEANVRFLRDSLRSLDQAANTPSESTSRSNRRHLSYINPQRDPRIASNTTSRTSNLQNSSAQPPPDDLADLSRQEHLRLLLARLNRTHDPAGPSASAYSNRTPSPNRQSLYDWAPSHEELGQEDAGELDQILTELRRQQPDTHPDILRVLSQSQLETTRRRERENSRSVTPIIDLTDAERRERLREHTRRRRDPEWASLRSRAIQRARREGSPSATAATERMLRYVMERERSGMSEEEERARGAGWFRRPSPARAGTEEQGNAATGNGRESGSTSDLRPRAGQDRRHLAENVPPRLPRISTPPVPPVPSSSNSPPHFLDHALKYLSDLRSCCRYEEALSAAIDNGLALKEFFADKHEDFVTNVDDITTLSESSWLQPGTVFQGHQHATNGNPGLLQTRGGSSPHSVEQINPNYRTQTTNQTANQGDSSTAFDHPPGSTRVAPFDATRPWLSHQPTVPTSAGNGTIKSADLGHDHWPVRVVIHAVDHEKMLLQGTMEAYDVPQPQPVSFSSLHSTGRPKAGKKHDPITTYLEGHIIDLKTHSFLTPSAITKRGGSHRTNSHSESPHTALSDTICFPSANAHIDAGNWRKLPPFNGLTGGDDTVARCLLSKANLEAINDEYIFMRWKEKCFVHSKDDKCSEAERSGDQDRGHGLTISGFYYVSLRRSDGAVEGLYFDPTSTPYQHLRLRGSRRGWSAFEFR